MFPLFLKITTILCMSFTLVAAGLIPVVNSNIQIRNAPGASSEETLRTLSRSLSSIIHQRQSNQVYRDNVTLDTSWNGGVLFSAEIETPSGNRSIDLNGSINIICTTCYVKGIATAQMDVKGNFTKAFNNLTSEIAQGFGNISTAVVNYVDKFFDNATAIILDDSDFPPLDVNFDIDVPEIPDTDLTFQFDKMELYMQVDTILNTGVTYTINMYTSRTQIGFKVADLLVGVVFTIDLILDVTGEIDISSGFHIQLNDGIEVKIPIFGQNVQDITYNGGRFEFLPVSINSAGVVFTGTLRLGITAGIHIPTPDAIEEIDLLKFVDVAAAVEASVWLDVASFKTNITAAPATNGNDCVLRVVEEYSMAIGAGAGAFLQIANHTWGPEPKTLIPLFYTTLADRCAIKKTTTTLPVSATASIEARQNFKTTTSTTKVTYTATTCISSGLINCPASLQSVTSNVITKTLTATVTSGASPVFVNAVNTVVSTIAFQTKAQKMEASSGSPVSYVPTSTATPEAPGAGAGGPGILNLSKGGVNRKIIIGVSLGIGIPVLLLAIAGLVYFCRRRRQAVTKRTKPRYHGTPVQDLGLASSWTDLASKKLPNVNVVEFRR